MDFETSSRFLSCYPTVGIQYWKHPPMQWKLPHVEGNFGIYDLTIIKIYNLTQIIIYEEIKLCNCIKKTNEKKMVGGLVDCYWVPAFRMEGPSNVVPTKR